MVKIVYRMLTATQNIRGTTPAGIAVLANNIPFARQDSALERA